MSSEPVFWIDARDKPGLLLAMMRQFQDQSNISFEGSLGQLTCFSWPAASYEENQVLKRQTTSPELDFVVIPLTEQSVKDIWKELCEKDHLAHEGIIHVQIENNGRLVFGGYDNFHRECTVAYPGVPLELLEKLKEQGIIREYEYGKVANASLSMPKRLPAS